MSEAKYKVGDQVTINGGDGVPVEVIDVVTLYYVNTYPTPMALRGSQIRPYVRPLAVGDRVRHRLNPLAGGIIKYRNSSFVCVEKSNRTLGILRAVDLERIPDADDDAGKGGA